MTSHRYWNTMIRCHASGGKDRMKSRKPQKNPPKRSGNTPVAYEGKPK